MKSQLKTMRENIGKTQSQVAKEVGITERGYQKIELKNNHRSVMIAVKIAKSLNMNAGDMELLFGDNQKI